MAELERGRVEQPASVSGPVLVVEDDPDVRDTIAEVLQAAGYSVLTAAHGAEALALLRGEPSRRPCTIILDLMMPVMDGWELRRALLDDARLASIPVVVLTGDAHVTEKAEGLRAAAAIAKPVSIQELFGVVARCCRRS